MCSLRRQAARSPGLEVVAISFADCQDGAAMIYVGDLVRIKTDDGRQPPVVTVFELQGNGDFDYSRPRFVAAWTVFEVKHLNTCETPSGKVRMLKLVGGIVEPACGDEDCGEHVNSWIAGRWIEEQGVEHAEGVRT